MSERRPPNDPVPWTPEDEAAMERRQAELTMTMLQEPRARRETHRWQKWWRGQPVPTARGPLLESKQRR